MGRKSKIESHPHQKKILKRLASGDDYSDIIREFPDITWNDLDYYEKNKLSEILSKSTDLKAEIQSDQGNDTLSDIKALKARAVAILEEAQAAGDLKTALLGIREARSCLETILKAEGQMQDQPSINILVNPEWIQLQALIITALKPYPEAMEAVRHALPSA